VQGREGHGTGKQPAWVPIRTPEVVSLALVGQVSVMTALKTLCYWMENVSSNDFSAYYKLEHMVHSHVASVRRETKMHNFFTVANH